MDTRDKHDPEDPSRPTVSPSSSYDRLPPKLREKLEASHGMGDMDEPRSGSPLPAILTALVVVMVGVGGFLWWKSSHKGVSATSVAQAEQEHQDSLRAVAAAESVAAVARVDSAAMAAAPDVTTRKDAGGKPAVIAKAIPPAPARAQPAAPASRGSATTGGATAAAPRGTPSALTGTKPKATTTPTGTGEGSTPPPTRTGVSGGFGIDVGSFLFEDRANEERTRLEGATGLPGIVSSVTSGGGSGFRVILGKFSSRGVAEQKAAALVDSNLVRQAQVVARPK